MRQTLNDKLLLWIYEASKEDDTYETALYVILWLLTAALMTLKLSGVITWPWWAVLAPAWAPVVGVIALGIWLGVVLLQRGKNDRTR